MTDQTQDQSDIALEIPEYIVEGFAAAVERGKEIVGEEPEILARVDALVASVGEADLKYLIVQAWNENVELQNELDEVALTASLSGLEQGVKLFAEATRAMLQDFDLVPKTEPKKKRFWRS